MFVLMFLIVWLITSDKKLPAEDMSKILLFSLQDDYYYWSVVLPNFLTWFLTLPSTFDKRIYKMDLLQETSSI